MRCVMQGSTALPRLPPHPAARRTSSSPADDVDAPQTNAAASQPASLWRTFVLPSYLDVVLIASLHNKPVQVLVDGVVVAGSSSAAGGRPRASRQHLGPAEQHEAQGEDQDWSAAAEAQWMDSVKMFPVSADGHQPPTQGARSRRNGFKPRSSICPSAVTAQLCQIRW